MPLKRPKKLLARLLLIVLPLCLLAGCATVPPKQITGAPTATQTPTEPPALQASPGDLDPALNPDLTPTPQATDTPQAQTVIAPSTEVTRVELFYSGTASMMGFVDAPQATIYENTMEALPACVSLCWPNASTSFYRYGADVEKSQMALSKDTLLLHIREPYFYLDAAMTKQPYRIKREGAVVTNAEENLNEPIRSLYDVLGTVAPIARSDASGTPVAVNASDPAALTLIVTDLHELRMDDGALLSALNEHCLSAGRSIGVAAISSEFAGYIPGLGVNNTSFVWGSPPTGTLDYTLDYSDYKVGVSIDPEQRTTASRPFYVLCIGEQSAVNTFLQALGDRLSREFTGNPTFGYRTAVYGSGYVPADYTLGGNMRFLSGQGVTAIPDTNAPGGISLVELKASPMARYLEWDVDYTIHPADPRGSSLEALDFTFAASAVAADGAATVLPHLNWTISATSGNTVTLRLRLEFPESILPQGSYSLEILGSLTAPQTLPGSDWLSDLGFDASGGQIYQMEQNELPFDGSRTLYLSRLIDTLGKANLGRLGVAPLGTVTIALTVYA